MKEILHVGTGLSRFQGQFIATCTNCGTSFPNTQGKMLKVQSAKYQLAPGADGSLLHSPMLLRY